MLEPAALVALAARRAVTALALTDHDTTAGLAEARATGEQLQVDIVNGVEISCSHGTREVHVLGLFIDPSSASLSALLESSRQSREAAVHKALERLATIGAPLELEDVLCSSSGESLGRMHLARALVVSGHVQSTSDAFARYLGEDRPARVHRERPSVADACEVIRQAGGISSLAHPGGEPGLPSQAAVAEMARAGLDAIEVHHPAHDERTRRRLEGWASSLRLATTGGSDFHGTGEGAELGACWVDEGALVDLRKLARTQRL